jgi:Putative prokaryotic signal transducing protein
MGLALVTRMPSWVEAQIAAGALRSAGIAAEVFDGNFGQVEAPVIESLGGFRIMAPEEEAASARQILKTLQSGPGLGEPDEYGPWSTSAGRVSRGRARGMRVLAAVLLGIPLVLWLIRFLGR